MAISDLKNVLKIFGNSDTSGVAQDELYKESLLMTLARAAHADVNIQAVGGYPTRGILKQRTGEEFSAAELRVAAGAEPHAGANLKE